MSIIGASWYAASKLTTACQLRGLPATAVLGREADAEQAGRARACEQLALERLVPAGEIAAIAVVGDVRRGHLRAQEPADLLAERGEVVVEQEIGKHEFGERVGSLRT